MEKRVLFGVQKRRPIKRNNKKFLKKVVDYLNSDSYLFAPLVSSSAPQTFHSSIAGVEFKEPSNGNNKGMLKKFVDYLKSDTYMYASLVDPPQSVRKSQKGIPGPLWKINKLTMKVSTRETTIKDNNHVINEAADDQAPKDYFPESIVTEKQSLVHGETVKQMIYNNFRSSSIEDKQMLGSQMRKLS